ncbi:hypothetical protein MASR2M12_14680 [Bacteroidales bacterium]
MADFPHYLSKQLGLTALLAILTLLVKHYFGNAWYTQAWPYIMTLFVTVNCVLFFLNQRVSQKKLSAFANYFMLASTIKLLLYLAVIVVYLYYCRTEAIPFLITFFIYYLTFTYLEVRGAVHKKKTPVQ